MENGKFNKQIKCVTMYGTMERDRNPLSVLIIGNGFDLDLGMHTSYSDFAKSEIWPFKEEEKFNLGNYLNKRKEIVKWLDIEKEFANYACNIIIKPRFLKRVVGEDKKAFNVLTNKLGEFLKAEQDDFFYVDGKCVAKQVLENIFKQGNYFIHSFNYTDIVEISNKLGIHLNRHKVEYIHGTIANNDIILGTGDNTDLPTEYDFLYKTFNKNYTSNNLAESLNYAQEITIFGHSLGENDFDYFKPFFQKISQNVGVNYNHLTNERLKLTIYTRDEKSGIEIKRQLRKLTDNHLQGIYANCDFKIEYTKP